MTEEESGFMIPSLSLEEIEQLAGDICENKVFTTLDHYMHPNDHKMIMLVFQQILGMNDRDRKLFALFPPAMLYEYIDEATYKPLRYGGHSDVLGQYPMFDTMKMLNLHDAEILVEIIKKTLKTN